MPLHSWTRHSLLVGLVALHLMIGVVSAGAQQRNDEDAISSKIVEERLTGWKPTKDNEATPTKQLACVAGDLSGVWRSDGSQIKLFPLGNNRYRVLFTTSGCLDRWTLERTATYSNGTLLLNRPVEEYCPATYKRLFTIRTQRGICLISDDALAFHYKQHKEELTPSFMVFRNTTRTVKEISPVSKPLARPL